MRPASDRYSFAGARGIFGDVLLRAAATDRKCEASARSATHSRAYVSGSLPPRAGLTRCEWLEGQTGPNRLVVDGSVARPVQ